ncbi:MAG: GAF domain-containing sensor histidine kinase [Chloroflexi bacterium]|nr:MAG: GAF domain-containing sensor histidine kinase [Chloroflexota bacterium]
MVVHRPAHSFAEVIATRSLARFHAWILAGLLVLYLITFPIFKSPILISVPVVVAGWFYYQTGGLLASILGTAVNIFLFNQFIGQLNRSFLFDLQNGYLIGHFFVAGVSIMGGYLRGVFENLFQLNRRLRSQERFLSLSNMIVKKILVPNKSDRLFDDIANHLTNLFLADYGYLIRWDQDQEKAFLIAVTNPLEVSYINAELNPGQTRIIENVVETGQALFIEDTEDTPSIINSLKLTKTPHQIRSAICFPLVAREYKFGTAILANESARPYTAEDLAYAERVGYQIALALWTVKQDEISRQQLNETRTLMQIGQALGETVRVGLDVVLQQIVDSARKLIPQAQKTVIHLVDSDSVSLIPQATSGFRQGEKTTPNLRMQIGSGVAGQVLRDGITANIMDVNTDPRFLHTNIMPAYRSLLVAPVQTASKQLGTISVESEKSHAFSMHEVELLKALGNQAAIAIENTRLFETTQQSLKEVNALYKINQGLAASLDADQLIQDVLTLLKQNFGYYYIQIYLLDPINGELIFKRGSDEVGTKLFEQGFRLPRGKGIIGYVAETATPFVTNNVNDVVFFYRNPLLPNTQSELAVPIKVEGRVVGVLDIQHEPPQRLSREDLQLMIAVANQLAVALQKANLYADLQKALQQEQSMRSQLLQVERLALIGQLLASISHELNNPLQTIQNALFLLKDELKQSGEGLDELSIISSEADRMVTLLDQLRSTYRPLHAEEFKPVQVNDIIQDVHKLISTHLRHKDINFMCQLETDLPFIRGISDHIKQVALNLFMNAVEAMPAGGSLFVETCQPPAKNEIVLSIKDTGMGIDPDLISRIFEPFVTGKEAGTGLGLTITHEIVQQHHGRILAENNPDGGAKFTVWLPVWKGGRR